MQMRFVILPILLLINAFLVPETHQLPLPGTEDQPAGCFDPLHHLMTPSDCEYEHRPVYVMLDDCPAKSVCIPEAELAACPQPFQEEASPACPPETPVRLFEYSPEKFVCPRQRCVGLGCFTDFCRARRLGKFDWQPLMVGKDGCDYLHCGCPGTEAELLAEGCQSHREFLMLTVDSRSGCPVKQCTQRLPDSVKPLFPTTASSTLATTLLTTPRPTECPTRIACPQNTSELTVPNSEPGGCPLRICLLPELIGPGSGLNYSSATRSLSNATTASALNSGATFVTETPLMTASNQTPTLSGASEILTSTGEQVITTAVPFNEITSKGTARVFTTVPVEQNTTNSTAMEMTTGAIIPAA